MPAQKLTATHIKALTEGAADAALVRYRDGSLDVIPSVADEPLTPAVKALKLRASSWAHGLLDDAERARIKAEQPTHLNSLRADAARAGNAELAKLEAAAPKPAPAVEAVVPTPPLAVPPLPLPRRHGRHVAPLSPASRELEQEAWTHLVVEVLEVVDAA